MELVLHTLVQRELLVLHKLEVPSVLSGQVPPSEAVPAKALVLVEPLRHASFSSSKLSYSAYTKAGTGGAAVPVSRAGQLPTKVDCCYYYHCCHCHCSFRSQCCRCYHCLRFRCCHFHCCHFHCCHCHCCHFHCCHFHCPSCPRCHCCCLVMRLGPLLVV